MRYITLGLALLWVFPNILAQPADWDADADAMPDYWEFHRSLNPADPKDAWLDYDNDGYINLYEYKLGSDPQNPNQPFIINWDQENTLAEAILNAPRGAVLRIPAGTYPLNFSFPQFNEAPRLLIEGGWDDTFTVRDYCTQITEFNGGRAGPILDFQLFEGNSGAIILDGIHFRQAHNGAVRFYGVISKVQLTIANCTFVDNETSRFGAVIDVSDGPFSLITDFILVNTLIAQNKGTGLKSTFHANKANLIAYHTVIADNSAASNDFTPRRSGHAIDCSINTDTAVTVQIVNSIFWNNENSDLSFQDIAPMSLQLINEHNNYQSIELDSQLVYYPPPTNWSVDPSFLSPGTINYGLPAQSLLIGNGMQLGVEGINNEVNIGLIGCEKRLLTNLREPFSQDSHQPFVAAHFLGPELYVRYFLPSNDPLRLQIWSVNGVKQMDYRIQSSQYASFNLWHQNVSFLTAGMYIITLSNGHQWLSSKVIKDN